MKQHKREPKGRVVPTRKGTPKGRVVPTKTTTKRGRNKGRS